MAAKFSHGHATAFPFIFLWTHIGDETERVVIVCVNSWVELSVDLSKVPGLKRYLSQMGICRDKPERKELYLPRCSNKNSFSPEHPEQFPRSPVINNPTLLILEHFVS
ncbi:hypothetical protein QYE76_053772 [Lolium multiflorum]|uniref:Uncharacterized protein n=1 Tax=Lolium multiflorum TaxID=4521 RepID=A0AAD8SY58_LOLMU|nr:hypothetical protein QYE76_053772 [Lolium multiflorum]